MLIDEPSVSVLSLQPQTLPGVSQVLVEVKSVEVLVAVVSSLQPQSLPGVSQVVVDDVGVVDVVDVLPVEV